MICHNSFIIDGRASAFLFYSTCSRSQLRSLFAVALAPRSDWALMRWTGPMTSTVFSSFFLSLLSGIESADGHTVPGQRVGLRQSRGAVHGRTQPARRARRLKNKKNKQKRNEKNNKRKTKAITQKKQQTNAQKKYRKKNARLVSANQKPGNKSAPVFFYFRPRTNEDASSSSISSGTRDLNPAFLSFAVRGPLVDPLWTPCGPLVDPLWTPCGPLRGPFVDPLMTRWWPLRGPLRGPLAEVPTPSLEGPRDHGWGTLPSSL